MTDTTRPLALVTGASSGIGLGLAREFTDHGFDVVVNAEDDSIHAAARTLTGDAEVTPVRADLTTPGGVGELWHAVLARGRPLDAAALNAGVGVGGSFLATELEDELEVIDLNVTSTVRLAKRVLPGMVERGAGRMLVTSSVASQVPGPYQAVYNASKSFLQSFAQALNGELRGTGVTVTSLMPGATDTGFFDRAGMGDTAVGRGEKDDPSQVARQGFEAMMAGRAKTLAGSRRPRAQGAAAKVLPDAAKAAAHRRIAEPGSGGDT